MKIVNNLSLKIILISFLFSSQAITFAFAADTPPAAPASSSATSAATSASTPAAPSTTASATPAMTPSPPAETAVAQAHDAPGPSSIALPQPPSPPEVVTVATSSPPPGPKQPPGAALANAENKVSDSVKDVLKKLDKPTDDVTLDDLNSARQAIARIEILIEVEKHLAELEKLRHERQKDTAVATMIPASALAPPPPAYQPPQPAYQPPQVQPVVQQMPVQPMPIMPSTPKEPLDVSQILGEGGHYSAVMKMMGDEAKTVHVGDKLADGSSVIDISSTEVVLQRGDTKRTLHIKNVETVFGSNSF